MSERGCLAGAGKLLLNSCMITRLGDELAAGSRWDGPRKSLKREIYVPGVYVHSGDRGPWEVAGVGEGEREVLKNSGAASPGHRRALFTQKSTAFSRRIKEKQPVTP